MYERFNDRARKVMQLSLQEARRFNHEHVGTEHILLGLVSEGSSDEGNVLRKRGVDPFRVRTDVERIVQAGPDMVAMGKMPGSPRAKKVLDSAIAEASTSKHDLVGPEHLLLGLLREEEGVAYEVLRNLGLNLEELRNEVRNTGIQGPGPQ